MHYWNRKNFEGLRGLSSELSSIPELNGLAEYCNLREKGLRTDALQALHKFIQEAIGRDVNAKRRIVLDILSADARTPEAHQFLTHPILTQLLFPTLEEWLSESPAAFEPLRWLGLMKSDFAHLEAALSAEPSDVPVRRRLIGIELDNVDYATHHLDESILLSPLDECRSSLFRVGQLLDGYMPSKWFESLAEEYKEYVSMLDDWELFNQSEYNDFPEWCRANDRHYRWPTKVYYDG
ncbi:MAG: hypothetical protein Q7Q71_03515 [Verrucomicrobiota bacterium JB023]|nr:hypothetical protein [Verrucomicrobiota bacterium JB023]